MKRLAFALLFLLAPVTKLQAPAPSIKGKPSGSSSAILPATATIFGRESSDWSGVWLLRLDCFVVLLFVKREALL